MSGRSDHRASDVWAALVFLLLTFPAWRGPCSKRVRGDVRTIVGDLGMFAITHWSRTVRGCELHHRRLLVHGFDFVCKSGGNNCPLLI